MAELRLRMNIFNDAEWPILLQIILLYGRLWYVTLFLVIIGFVIGRITSKWSFKKVSKKD